MLGGNKKDGFYTSLHDAKKELQRRRNDPILKKKADDFLRNNIPFPFRVEPGAVLARHITSPNMEHLRFLEMAKEISLKPYSWEYTQDKFYTINSDKLSLARMRFFTGDKEKCLKDKKSMTKKKIIFFKEHEGKPIRSIRTLWGQDLVDFHHDLLRKAGSNITLFEGSDWYLSFDFKSKEYYKYFLAVFIRNAILFENFSCVGDPQENKFINEVFLPALKDVETVFGMKPLIVRTTPQEEDIYTLENPYWMCYPKHLEEYVNDHLKNIK